MKVGSDKQARFASSKGSVNKIMAHEPRLQTLAILKIDAD